MEHPIQGLMKATMENLKEMVDVNTIIGEPVQTADGGVILTVSKVSFGYGAGGSDFSTNHSAKEKEHLAFGGGSAGGVSITPVAFLVVNNDGVNIMHLQNGTHLAEKLIDLAPQTFSKIQTMFSQSNAMNPNMENQTNSMNMTSQANMENPMNMTNQANMTNATNMENQANMTTPANMTSQASMTNPTSTTITTTTDVTNLTNEMDTTNSANPMNVTSSVEEKMKTTETEQNDIF